MTVAANVAPTASFTDTENLLALSVNGSASSDPDGTVAGYSWSWGDGTPDGTGATATHAYAAAGTYTVTLTVTDDHGASPGRALGRSPSRVRPTRPRPRGSRTPRPLLQTAVNGSTSSDPDGTHRGLRVELG